MPLDVAVQHPDPCVIDIEAQHTVAEDDPVAVEVRVASRNREDVQD